MGKWNPTILDEGTDRERAVILIPANLKTQTFYYTTPCKHCGRLNTVKYGTYRGVQRYWCRSAKGSSLTTMPCLG